MHTTRRKKDLLSGKDVCSRLVDGGEVRTQEGKGDDLSSKDDGVEGEGGNEGSGGGGFGV